MFSAVRSFFHFERSHELSARVPACQTPVPDASACPQAPSRPSRLTQPFMMGGTNDSHPSFPQSTVPTAYLAIRAKVSFEWNASTSSVASRPTKCRIANAPPGCVESHEWGTLMTLLRSIRRLSPARIRSATWSRVSGAGTPMVISMSRPQVQKRPAVQIKRTADQVLCLKWSSDLSIKTVSSCGVLVSGERSGQVVPRSSPSNIAYRLCRGFA